MIFFVMFLSGVLLYLIGSALDKAERRRRERELDEWCRLRVGPHPASGRTPATPTRGAGQ